MLICSIICLWYWKKVISKMDSTSIIIWGMLFGAIGLGFFTYGKKQKAVVPLSVGVALFVIPYIMPNVWMLVTAGGILVVLPYFVRI